MGLLMPKTSCIIAAILKDQDVAIVSVASQTTSGLAHVSSDYESSTNLPFEKAALRT